jgi:hypothetical protein
MGLGTTQKFQSITVYLLAMEKPPLISTPLVPNTSARGSPLHIAPTFISIAIVSISEGLHPCFTGLEISFRRGYVNHGSLVGTTPS